MSEKYEPRRAGERLALQMMAEDKAVSEATLNAASYFALCRSRNRRAASN